MGAVSSCGALNGGACRHAIAACGHAPIMSACSSGPCATRATGGQGHTRLWAEEHRVPPLDHVLGSRIHCTCAASPCSRAGGTMRGGRIVAPLLSKRGGWRLSIAAHAAHAPTRLTAARTAGRAAHMPGNRQWDALAQCLPPAPVARGRGAQGHGSLSCSHSQRTLGRRRERGTGHQQHWLGPCRSCTSTFLEAGRPAGWLCAKRRGRARPGTPCPLRAHLPTQG